MVKQKEWALVLSGGGARGGIHVGVIKALEELELVPSFVAGTSIGSVMGGLWAAGNSAADLEKSVRTFNIRDHISLNTAQFLKTNTAVSRIIQLGEAAINLMQKKGCDNGDKIRDKLFELTEGKKFSDCKCPFMCNAADLLTSKNYLFEQGYLADAMRASISMPGVFEPYNYNGHLFVDGGVLDNLLINATHKKGYRRIVAVNVNPSASMNEIQNGIDVLMFATTLNSQNVLQRSKKLASILLEFEPQISTFNIDKIGDLITVGYDETMARKDDLFTAVNKRSFS